MRQRRRKLFSIGGGGGGGGGGGVTAHYQDIISMENYIPMEGHQKLGGGGTSPPDSYAYVRYEVCH